MKWTCHVKATVLLPSVFCLFLALRVSASPAERAAVPPPVHSRQTLSLGSPERLREQAVERGRSGDYQSAIDTLAGLYERDPDDAGAFHDLLIILGWAERDREALHLADRLAPQTAPVEVLETLAKSSRNIGDFAQSVRWYERAISRSPARLESQLGLALAYADLGQQEQALRVLPVVSIGDWRSRRMWLVAIELLVSTFWAYAMLASFLLWLLGKFVGLPDALQAPGIIPGWGGVLLGFTCLVQFAVSLTIDSRYEPKLGRYYYWMVWYPLVYWALQAAATCVAVPKALLGGLKSRGTWTSPDRGIRTSKVS